MIVSILSNILYYLLMCVLLIIGYLVFRIIRTCYH